LEIAARAIKQNFEHDHFEVTIWDEGAFCLSKSAMESLGTVLTLSDFAIFVLSPSDVTKIRGSKYKTVRDNVIPSGPIHGEARTREVFFVVPRARRPKASRTPTDRRSKPAIYASAASVAFGVKVLSWNGCGCIV
jgi:hypothetical protein